jgi:ABC-2 type transport system permease protein
VITILIFLQKELWQIRRDRKIVMMLVVAPVFQLVLLGYAATFDIRHIPLAVCDLDVSAESRRLVESFTNSGYFAVVRQTRDMAELDGVFAANLARVGLVIPRGFERDLAKGAGTALQIITDGTDSMSSAAGAGYARMIASRISGPPEPPKGAAGPPVLGPELRIWYNPELKSSYFMVPAIFALLLSLVAMAIPSMAIVKEKELGTIEQLYVTPIRPYQLILGKMLPFVLISFVNVVLVTAIANLWFGVPLRGSLAALSFAVALFLLSSLGLGLFVSTLVQTQQQAMMVAIFIIMMPSILLSGFAFPVDNIPATIRPISYALPVTYFINILRGVFLRGATIADLWWNYAALGALGPVILAASILKFKKGLG